MNTYTITIEVEARSHSEMWQRVLDTAFYRDTGRHYYFQVPGRLHKCEIERHSAARKPKPVKGGKR